MLNDILRETPIYQSIKRTGLEEEREQRVTSLRPKILLLQHTRFPKLSQLANKRVAQITRPDVLEDLMLKLALAQDSDEAQEALMALAQGDQANSAS